MGVRVAELAELTGSEWRGAPDAEVSGVGTLADAGPDQITFLANRKYRKFLEGTRAGAVICTAADADVSPVPALVAADPYVAYAKIARRLVPVRRATGVHPSAVVDPSATLGARVTVGPGCVVGPGVTLGDDTWLVANVTVMHGCLIGARVTLHPGVVVGADGFGIANDNGRWINVPQLGTVRIGDDCEVGANTTIDRGALDDTVLEDGVKLDNLVMVAHNVHIGAHTAIAGCAAIAGSTRIGSHCTIGGKAGIVGHLEIVDHVHIAAGTLVSRSIHQPGSYGGPFPFDDNAAWQKNAAALRHLHALRDRLRALEKKLS